MRDGKLRVGTMLLIDVYDIVCPQSPTSKLLEYGDSPSTISYSVRSRCSEKLQLVSAVRLD